MRAEIKGFQGFERWENRRWDGKEVEMILKKGRKRNW